MHEVRVAVRTLLRQPSFTLVAVLALAIGIGANTAIFSVVNAVLLRPLPYAQPERVVRVYNHWEGSPDAGLSPAEYFDYLDRAEGLEHFGAYVTQAVNVTGGDRPERVPGGFVTAGLLRALGARPAVGRIFSEDETAPGGARVAILSDGFWRRRFGGARDVVGRDIVVNGVALTVIGILPPGFRLPDDFAGGGATDLYLPLRLDRAATVERGSHFLQAAARLAPGVPLERAQASLGTVAQEFVQRFPDDYPRDMRFGVHVAAMRDDVVGSLRPTLLVLLGAVGFVLLIACANVSGLLMARVEDRRRELAVRAALGAGRRRLIQQLLTESLVLAAAGGALGLLLAAWGAQALVALQPGDLPRLDEVSLDPAVLAFALGASALAALLFGLLPALASRGDLTPVLREAGTRTTSGRATQRLRGALIVGEVALAVVLLAGAGLLVRSFAALVSVDPGYRTEQVLTVRLSLPSSEYPTDERRRDFFTALVQRARTLPGVVAAGATSNLPLAQGLGDLNFRIDGQAPREGEVSPRMDWQVVTPGYLDAIGLTLLRGRGIEADDDERAPGAVVINQAAARTLFAGRDPLGVRFVLGGEAGPGWVTVVGVVSDKRHGALADAPRPEMYLAHRQFHFWNGGPAVPNMTLVLHAAGDAAALAPAVRRAASELDPNLPLAAFETMEQLAAESVARPRFIMAVLGLFALMALLLAAIGIYGLMAYSVTRRTHELGIRIALGARAAQVTGMVMRQGFRLLALGVAIGLGAALLLTRSLAGLLYGVAPRDPASLAAGALALALAAALACWLPARRATRVDPIQALRSE